jgi:hypothetical protein
MAKQLLNLTVNEVSLVKKGANNKRIYLTKSQGTDQMNVEEIEKAAAEAKVALEKAEAEKAEVVAKLAALEKAQAEAVVEREALVKAQGEALEKASVEKAALEKALADQRDATEVAEAIQKASVDYKNLPESPEALGPMLRKVRKMDAATADTLDALLKKLDAVAKNALDPRGVAKGDDVAKSALDEISKRAKALVESGKFTSIAKATDAVLTSDKDLYNRYQAEKPANR